MRTLSNIPTEELQHDLLETFEDLVVCQKALVAGITEYSDGLVVDRLTADLDIVQVIMAMIEMKEEA